MSDANGSVTSSMYSARFPGTGGGATSGNGWVITTGMNTYGPYGRETDEPTVAISGRTMQLVKNGIQFGGAVGAYVAANQLNDYEEGTWLPTLEFVNAGGTATVTNSAYTTGSYTKIGQAVTVQFNISGITFGNGTGFVKFLGLPFTPNGITAYPGKNQASSGHLTSSNTASGYGNTLKIYGVTPMQVWYNTGKTATAWSQMTNSNASTVAPNSINGSFTYYTNS